MSKERMRIEDDTVVGYCHSCTPKSITQDLSVAEIRVRELFDWARHRLEMYEELLRACIASESFLAHLGHGTAKCTSAGCSCPISKIVRAIDKSVKKLK